MKKAVPGGELPLDNFFGRERGLSLVQQYGDNQEQNQANEAGHYRSHRNGVSGMFCGVEMLSNPSCHVSAPANPA